MPAERIIAIDFGTSTSVVRVKRYQDGKPIGDRLETKPVTFNMGSTVVPTLIQQRDTGENLYFGYDAEIPRRNTVILRNFKIEIEAPDPAVRERARELTAGFFRFLYKTYREQSLGGHLGETDDLERTVISYPVKWSEDTKAFMLETAKSAGFPNVEGQDEAQAAIQAVTVQSEQQLRDSGYLAAEQPANILLIDMGAGTTDLVLCRHTPGDAAQTEILATWPHGTSTLFGGQEVDELLRGYIKSLLPADSAEKVLKRLGSDKFKAWKEHDVSPALARDETVNEFSALDDRLEDMELDIGYSIDRRIFEDFAQDYLRGFPELISGCLSAAGMTGDQVDLVVLTGGHSQWYFVRKILGGKLDRFGETGLTKIQADPDRVISIALPQETVALGLAYGPLRAALPKSTPKSEAVSVPDSIKDAELLKLTSVLQQVQNQRSVLWQAPQRTVATTPPVLHTLSLARPDRPVRPKLPGKEASLDKIRNFYWKNRASVLFRWSDMYLLDPDGTVIYVDKQGNASPFHPNGQEWTGVVSIDGGMGRILGLRSDGSVLAYGFENKQKMITRIISEVRTWHNIVSIKQTLNHCFGLQADGSVISTSKELPLQNWRDIVTIDSDPGHLVGLRADGTVMATGGDNRSKECDVEGWKNIVSIAAGGSITVGLRSDGTVVATGDNGRGRCDVQHWDDVNAIVSSTRYTLGLQTGGTVLNAGEHLDNIKKWRDIMSIASETDVVVGRKMDGTAVADGSNKYGQCNVQAWKNILEIFTGMKKTLAIQNDGSVIYTDYNEKVIHHFFTGDETIITPLPTKTLPFKLF